MSKPPWLKFHIKTTPEMGKVRKILRDLHLYTVCWEAKCPNRGKCYSEGTATFMIMGNICTRNCRFCSVKSGMPQPLDPTEPQRVALAAKLLGLDYVVITSVTRDDLPDGGAAHFADVVRAILSEIPRAMVEVLIPDFKGNIESLKKVVNSGIVVLNHNVEVPKRLQNPIRPGASYERSLNILIRAKEINPGIVTKSGMMVGIGETKEEVFETLEDLAKAGVDIVTIGQYLQPTPKQVPVDRYVRPEEFEEYKTFGEQAGIKVVISEPLARSSYRAKEAYLTVVKMREGGGIDVG